jgi:nucleoside-diphosphate-sugar epimerase
MTSPILVTGGTGTLGRQVVARLRAVGRPRVYSVADLLRGYLRARRKRRLMVPVWLPGRAARAVRAGANLAPERAVGHRTWEDFLAERVSHEA